MLLVDDPDINKTSAAETIDKSGWIDVIDGGGATEVGINRPQDRAIDEVKNECGGRRHPSKPQAEKPVSSKRHEDEHHGEPREHAEDEPLDDGSSWQAFPEPGIHKAPIVPIKKCPTQPKSGGNCKPVYRSAMATMSRMGSRSGRISNLDLMIIKIPSTALAAKPAVRPDLLLSPVMANSISRDGSAAQCAIAARC